MRRVCRKWNSALGDVTKHISYVREAVTTVVVYALFKMCEGLNKASVLAEGCKQKAKSTNSFLKRQARLPHASVKIDLTRVL